MSESVLAGSAMRSSQWTSSGESPKSGTILITILDMSKTDLIAPFITLASEYLCVLVAFTFTSCTPEPRYNAMVAIISNGFRTTWQSSSQVGCRTFNRLSAQFHVCLEHSIDCPQLGAVLVVHSSHVPSHTCGQPTNRRNAYYFESGELALPRPVNAEAVAQIPGLFGRTPAFARSTCICIAVVVECPRFPNSISLQCWLLTWFLLAWFVRQRSTRRTSSWSTSLQHTPLIYKHQLGRNTKAKKTGLHSGQPLSQGNPQHSAV